VRKQGMKREMVGSKEALEMRKGEIHDSETDTADGG